jgi:hypothetical protein
MKKAATITLCILMLAGCERRASETVDSARDLYVFRDNGSGCEYVGLQSARAAAITPRMGQDGKQICGKVQP